MSEPDDSLTVSPVPGAANGTAPAITCLAAMRIMTQQASVLAGLLTSEEERLLVQALHQAAVPPLADAGSWAPGLARALSVLTYPVEELR